MDFLSEILSAVRLEGALFFNAEFTAPWCLNSSGSEAVRPYLPVKGEHLIMFHFLTEGRAYASLNDGERVELRKGDIVVFPRGDAHVMGNGVPRKPADSFKAFSPNLYQGANPARFGGGGEVTQFVCGYMACDTQLCEIFLRGLPRLLRVPVAEGASGRWIENSIRFSVGESKGPDAGRSLVVAKLSEVLFVETLRSYIAALPPAETGWFAGLRDPFVANALAMLHLDPGRAWTVDSLAKKAGLSRTRLAERFRTYLQMSPMAYLTELRMRLGAEALRSTRKTVVEVASEAGYNSEAAFNRAFKRTFQVPPAQFRQSHKTLEQTEKNLRHGAKLVRRKQVSPL
jgi:AraC-like DNA-binding protein